jgi:uncharacterized membrane protein YcgQ (UPF0703/DUF1980 family)
MNPARLIQSIGWMAFLGVMLMSGSFVAYIAKFQIWVLVAATALFGVLVLIDALVNRTDHHHDHDHHDHDHGTPTDQWVQTLVHLLPLFLFLTMGVTTLGSQSLTSLKHAAPHSVLSSRHAQGAGTPPVVADPPGAAQPPPPAANPTTTTDEPLIAPVAPPVLLDGPTPAEPIATPLTAKDPAIPAAVPLPLMELYYPKKHPGVTRVETIGRLMIPTQEEIDKVPPEVDRTDLKLLLYRYVMTCCAADAAPVFVVLRGREPSDLKVDDWVKISGTWIPAPGLGDMAKIEVYSLTIIEQPAETFLQAPKE